MILLKRPTAVRPSSRVPPLHLPQGASARLLRLKPYVKSSAVNLMAGIPSYFSASASSFPRRRICQIGKSGLRLRFQPLDEEAFLLFAIRLNDTPSIAARLRTAASPRFSCSPIMAAVLPASANVRSRCPSSGVHGGDYRRMGKDRGHCAPVLFLGMIHLF
jgi:hypothetical protein